MIKGKEFATILASPPEYDQLVAEIYWDGLFVALISQELAPGVFQIEMPGPDLQEAQIRRSVELNGFLRAVEDACRRLREEKP